MRIQTFTLILMCLVLCSCSHSSKILVGGIGEDPDWVSNDQARRIGWRLLTNSYPQAQIVTELGEGRTVTYRFATNGTVLPMAVVVDRKTGKASFESSGH